MKKKLFSILLSTILLLTFVEGAAAGSPTAVISAGSGSGNPGDTNISVQVRLNSQDGARVAGLNFDLSYDVSRLNVSNVTIGSAASPAGKTMSWSRPSSDTVRVIIFGLNQDTIPNGTVANVIFNVLVGAAPGTSSLTLSHAAATDPSGGGIGVNLNNGSFTVLSPPATTTPTSAPTDTPVVTSTPTSAPTDTLVPTHTPTSAPTDTPIPTYTSTITPLVSPTPTMTPTIEPSPPGGPSSTPIPTKTSTPSASATSEIKPTSSATPTPNPTTSSETTSTPIEGESGSPTPLLEGETLSDQISASEATAAAEARLEAAVAATATALAKPRQGSVPRGDTTSGLSNLAHQWGDVILLAGAMLGGTLLMIGLFYELLRRKPPKKSRKRIY
jgi:hypothetical protein